MKCSSDKCSLKPELCVSGWHSPHPTYFCPVCRESYWEHVVKDEKETIVGIELKNFPPFKWGAKSKDHYLSSSRYGWVKPANAEGQSGLQAEIQRPEKYGMDLTERIIC